MSKKPASTKGSKAKPEQATKPTVTLGVDPAPAKGKAKPEPTAKQPSNKERIYRLWLKSDEKSPKEAEAMMAKAKVDVKLTTVRGWISAWNNGKNLPRCAKED